MVYYVKKEVSTFSVTLKKDVDDNTARTHIDSIKKTGVDVTDVSMDKPISYTVNVPDNAVDSFKLEFYNNQLVETISAKGMVTEKGKSLLEKK